MNILQKSHQWILENTDKYNLAIDMTCGNGHDTQFLAEHFNRVITIDIQDVALKNTQQRLINYQNIEYIHQDHSLVGFSEYKPINGAIYNLGYLPHSDKSVITTKDSTLNSLNNLFPYLSDFLVIVCYIGHEGGKQEADAVYEWINNHNLLPEVFRYEGKEKSPIAYCIKL